MGGERETTIGNQPAAEKPVPSGITIQDVNYTPVTPPSKLRIHENAAEQTVHFHDDTSGLKCAVPLPEMWSAWNKLKSLQLKEWTYWDKTNNSELIVKMHISSGVLESQIWVRKFTPTLGDSFSKIEQFFATRIAK